MSAESAPLKFLPDRHTDFRFHVGIESPADVFALLAIVALIGFGIWWFLVRRRR